MFDVLSGLARAASTRAKQLADEGYELVKQSGFLDLEEEYSDTRKAQSDFGRDNTVCVAVCEGRQKAEDEDSVKIYLTRELFLVPSSEWESPAEEWQMLVEAVLMEKNSCIIPPKRITENEALASKMCDLLNVSFMEDLPKPPSLGSCGPSEDIKEWLTSTPVQLEFWSSLVPCYVSDDQYWVNLVWRFALYRMCRNSKQLLDLMEVLSTESNPLDTTSELHKKNVGDANNASYWQKLRDTLINRWEFAEWLKCQIKNVHKEMELASGNFQLLTNVIKKGEKTELGDSVLESCKYNKTKLTRLMGDLKMQQERLNNSVLCPENGSLFAELAKLNQGLRVKIEAYLSLSSGSTSEGWESVPCGIQEEVTLRSGTFEKNEADDTVFEAALPWEGGETEKEVET